MTKLNILDQETPKAIRGQGATDEWMSNGPHADKYARDARRG